MPSLRLNRAATPLWIAALSTVVLLTPVFLAAMSAHAHDYKLKEIEIKHPWTRATPKGAKIAGGYLTLVNHGAAADRLVSMSSGNAGRVEIHEMKEEHGIMKMRPLSQGIAVAPGETVTFAPGGLHVMFMDLKGPLAQGENLAAQLVFEKAGAIDVTFKVEAMGARGGDGGHKGH